MSSAESNDAQTTPERTVDGAEAAAPIPDPPKAGDAFLCPNGCGPMLRRRCKLSCQRCGYYDSCSDFC